MSAFKDVVKPAKYRFADDDPTGIGFSNNFQKWLHWRKLNPATAEQRQEIEAVGRKLDEQYPVRPIGHLGDHDEDLIVRTDKGKISSIQGTAKCACCGVLLPSANRSTTCPAIFSKCHHRVCPDCNLLCKRMVRRLTCKKKSPEEYWTPEELSAQPVGWRPTCSQCQLDETEPDKEAGEERVVLSDHMLPDALVPLATDPYLLLWKFSGASIQLQLCQSIGQVRILKIDVKKSDAHFPLREFIKSMQRSCQTAHWKDMTIFPSEIRFDGKSRGYKVTVSDKKDDEDKRGFLEKEGWMQIGKSGEWWYGVTAPSELDVDVEAK